MSSLTLNTDVDCASFPLPAITIAGDNVVLDLNGHTITTAEGQAGIRLAAGVSNVTIKNGYIDGKGTAILIPGTCSNIEIKDMDMSLNPAETAAGYGIHIQNGGQVHNLMCDNVQITNKSTAMYFASSKVSTNVTVKNSSFNGNSNNGMSLYNINGLVLSNVQAMDNIIHGVSFSEITGIITIGNVNVAGCQYGVSFGSQPAGFPVINASTFTGFSSNTVAAFKFTSWGNTNGITLQNLNLGYDPSEPPTGYGIWIQNGGQVHDFLCDNVLITNRTTAVYFASSNVSTNVTVKNSSFNGNSENGMSLYNINGLVLNNVETKENIIHGVIFAEITGTIAIASVNVAGCQYGVTFGSQPFGFPTIDASTFTGFSSNSVAAFKFTSYGNTNGITLQNLNLGYDPSESPMGYGIWIQNGGQVHNLMCDNVLITNRTTAVYFASSKISTNVTLKNSSFNGNSENGMSLYNINGLMLNNLEAEDNIVHGVIFSKITGSITIGNVSIAGCQYGVTFGTQPAGFPAIDASTFTGFSSNSVAAFKFASYGNTNGITLQGLDLGYDPSKSASGYGIWIQNGGSVNQLLVENSVASNRSSAFIANSSIKSTEMTIRNCAFTGNSHGLNLQNIEDLTVEGNDLRWNDYGLAIGTITLPLSVFHNTIYGNSVWNAFGDGAYELWNHDILEGNYWGLTCDVAAFQAGVTSNLTTITDDYAYGQASGWEAPPENKCSLPCRRALQELTMFVDAELPNLNFGQGYAVAGGQFHNDQNSASYDNILDIVVANDNDYGWLYHGGASGYTKLDYSLGGPAAPGSGANRGLAVGFINDDPFPDIMMSHLARDTVFVYFGNGDGTVTLHQKLHVPRPMAVTLGNLNAPDPNNPNASGRDNDLDAFVATGGDYKNYVLHNGGAAGSYNFTPVELVYPQGTTPTHTSTAACMADLDEDGDLDVLVTSYSDGYGSYTPVKPQFLRNNGVGVFDEPFTNLFNVEVRGKDIECVDIDGSGLLDVYLATSDGYNNYIFTGIDLLNGSSNIINAGFPGIRCNALAVNDFNNDGLSDIYVATDVGHYDIIQFNTGTSPWYSTNFNFCNDDIEWIPGSYHKSYSVFPFDRDGDSDIDVYVGVGGANDVVYRNTLDPPNLAPTAEAGPNQTIECTSHSGMPVTLDGTQSTDPDNDALTYLWKLGSTQIATTATVQLTLGLGTYTYTLTVNDGKGGTHSDDVTIVIKDETDPVLTMVTSPEVVSFSSNDLHQKFTLANIVSAVSDACDPAPVLKILSVTSDEPLEAPANNQQANSQNNPITTNDAIINAFCNEVELRRERMTSDYYIPNTNPQEKVIADGRAYIITVEARDASGNFTTGQYQVHIQSCNAGGNSQSNSGNGGNSSSNSNAGGNSSTACPVTVSAVQYTATCGMSKSFEAAVAPSAVRLHPNYPNPFNPTTTLSFSLPYEGDMRMLVFDGLGRTVKSWEGRYPAGTHTLMFDAGGLPSGVYFYRLITGSTVLTRRMLLTQ